MLMHAKPKLKRNPSKEVVLVYCPSSLCRWINQKLQKTVPKWFSPWVFLLHTASKGLILWYLYGDLVLASHATAAVGFCFGFHCDVSLGPACPFTGSFYSQACDASSVIKYYHSTPTQATEVVGFQGLSSPGLLASELSLSQSFKPRNHQNNTCSSHVFPARNAQSPVWLSTRPDTASSPGPSSSS